MKKTLLFSIVFVLLSILSFNSFSQITVFSEPSNKPKLKLGLSEIVSLVESNRAINATTLQSFDLYTFKEGNKKVLVEVIAQGNGKNLAKELSKLGIEVVSSSEKRVTCWVEITKISSLVDKSTTIAWIQPTLKPINNSGPVLSQGDSAQRSGIARKLTGLNGNGVKIGVLSDSYNSLNGAAASVTAGELPGVGNPNGFTTPVTVLGDITGGTDEGRAMLEIVHDVAPGAQLYFKTAYETEADFANAIRDLAAAGCKVIIDDISYFAEPFFQDGLVAQAVDEVTAMGVSYYSSAGNSVDNSYEAPYKASTYKPIAGSNETAHNFGTDALPIYELPIRCVNGLKLGLQWDDPFFSTGGGSAGATSDLNLYVYFNGSLIASSKDNNIGGDPFEYIGLNGTGNITILITKKAGTDPRNIKFIGYRGLSWLPTPPTIAGIRASTVFGHHNATGAIATGAASYNQTPAYGINPPIAESYSSKGGTPIYRSTSGALLPTPIIRPKPEIVAPDNANTSFFIDGYDPDGDGYYNFSGTSAAAPHAGAVAALMLQGNQLLTPNAIKTALINSCTDMDDPATTGFDTGFDYATGNGLIKADAAVLSTINPNCPSVVVTVTRPTTFCEGDSAILDANSGTGYSFQWKRNGVNIIGETQARLIAKQTGNYSVSITHLDCTLSSSDVIINAKIGVPVPVTVSRTITAGTTITSGNGLQASSNCHPQQTSTYTGPTIGYDGGTKSGADPVTSMAGASGNIVHTRISITWRKRSGGTINDCGTTGGNANPYNDEVSFKIVSPDNTNVNLLNANTYATGPYVGTVTTVFEDGGSAVGTVPASGTFRPAQALSSFIGKAANGNWKLIANDDASDDPLCVEGFSVTVYTDGPGGTPSTITWWTSQTGGTQVGTGSEYIPTDTAPGTYTYYAEANCAGSGLSCQTSIRKAATLTITSGCVAQGGSVTADATVCSGTNSGTLTLSGHVGTIVRWESSTDNFSSVITTIANTTTTQNYANLTQTTKYRAVVQNGSCPVANSTPATITVTVVNATASNTGPYTTGQTIQLNATGGTSYSWTGPNSFTSTSNPATINDATVAMTGTYTVTVTQGSCTATATTYVQVSDNTACSKIVDYDYVQAGSPFIFKFPLVNNMVIAQVPEETSILINPICPSVTIESFKMRLQGPAPFANHESIESVAPFSLFNNTGDMILGRHLPVGSYTLTVTGYSLDNASGSITYGPVVTNFTIVASTATISVPTFSVTSICAGNTFNVNFTTTGTFAPGNQFEVQLSDLYSSFDNPRVIGVSSSAGNVIATVPMDIIEGTGYKLRIVSTNQTIAGGSNGTTLAISPNSLALVSPANDFSGGTNTKRATENITASNKVFSPAKVTYEAGKAIVLNAGFQANSNAVFKAEIKGCANN